MPRLRHQPEKQKKKQFHKRRPNATGGVMGQRSTLQHFLPKAATPNPIPPVSRLLHLSFAVVRQSQSIIARAPCRVQIGN